LCSEDLHRISCYRCGSRHLGQRATVRASESQLAVRLSIDLVALFVDGAMVAATEHGEIRERGGAALGPVADVMALADANLAAREAAAAVPVVEGASQGGWNRPGRGTDTFGHQAGDDRGHRPGPRERVPFGPGREGEAPGQQGLEDPAGLRRLLPERAPPVPEQPPQGGQDVTPITPGGPPTCLLGQGSPEVPAALLPVL
jgi:hypothetical protein